MEEELYSHLNQVMLMCPTQHNITSNFLMFAAVPIVAEMAFHLAMLSLV